MHPFVLFVTFCKKFVFVLLMRKLFSLLIASLAIATVAFISTGCSRDAKATRHLDKAERSFAVGDYDIAEIEFINVLKNQPENRVAFTRLATIYSEQGRISRAVPFLFRALQLDTNNPDLRIRVGFLSLATGKVKEARTTPISCSLTNRRMTKPRFCLPTHRLPRRKLRRHASASRN